MILKKKDLAIQLSQLQTFTKPSANLEQYATDSELAAQLLWDASLQGDILGKTIADFGCGTGILGLGALLLGAKKVYFIDVDDISLSLAKENFALIKTTSGKTVSAEFLLQSVDSFSKKVDVVLQNPPFGVQQEHADRAFLERAMTVADVIYTIHKIESKSFIATLAKDHKFRVTSLQPTEFPLKKTQVFHTKRIYRVPVGIWRLERL